jgi:NADH-quinone oxidoreductase subunit N
VSVFFYLRVVVQMFMTERPAADATATPAMASMVALVVSALALFYLGLLPSRVMEIAAAAAAGVF